MKRASISILLGIAGVTLFVIGAAVLLFPHGFFASNGIILDNDPNLMSEIRAPGGLLIASGIVILAGVFRETYARTGLVVAVFVFGSYGIARLISIAMDNLPSASLLAATAVELVLAALCAAALASGERRGRTGKDVASLVA